MSGPSKVTRLPESEAVPFGKYQPIAKLGQGGMADVFLAVARGPGGFTKLVVIKRLKDGAADEGELYTMFADEARLAARLNHPNVVQTNEVGVEGGRHFLAMEFLEGQPLNRIMSRMCASPVSLSRLGPLLRVICDALAGLHYAHELRDYDGAPLKVVHRDVSPHNVFVTYDGVAKVVDFGIAKATVRSVATSTGVVKGKISYMAPEQALSAPIDRRADVFAMGVVLWEIVAGERLWGSMTEVQILRAMTFGEIPRLKARRPDAPDGLDRICATALAMVPAERYESAAAMRADLEAFMKDGRCDASVADVGALVSETFMDRREEIRRVIQEQLKHLSDGGVPPAEKLIIADIGAYEDNPLMPPHRLGSAPTVSAQYGATSEPTGTGVIGNSTAEIIRQTRTRSPVRWIVGAGVAVAGLAGAALWMVGSPPAERATVASAPSPVQASAPVPGPPLVELKVVVTPSTAALFIDRVQATTVPFSGKFAADGRMVTVRAEAPGMKVESRMVALDRDQVVEITLSPEAGTDSGALGTPGGSNHPSSAVAPRPGRPPAPKVDTKPPF